MREQGRPSHSSGQLRAGQLGIDSWPEYGSVLFATRSKPALGSYLLANSGKTAES
jgi:hypothetical protein